MLKNILKMFLGAVFVALMSGCAAVGFVGANVYMGGEAEKFPGTIEVGDIKTNGVANIALIKNATVSSVVFNKDMTEPNTTPSPSDTKVNAVVAEETRRLLGISGSPSSPVTVRLKTFYFDEGWYWGYYYYEKITEKNALTRSQKYGMQKLVNAHFTVEQGGSVLLEVHGFWGGNEKSDEIAGARQLAREVASEVLKKLSASSAPPPASVAEAETPKR